MVVLIPHEIFGQNGTEFGGHIFRLVFVIDDFLNETRIPHAVCGQNCIALGAFEEISGVGRAQDVHEFLASFSLLLIADPSDFNLLKFFIDFKN